MAVKGPGRRIDASNTPFNRMQHNAVQGKTTHNRRAMVQARGKPGQHASAEGVPAPAQELARAARQAGEPKRRVQGKQEGAGGEPAAVGTRERKQEGGQPRVDSAARTRGRKLWFKFMYRHLPRLPSNHRGVPRRALINKSLVRSRVAPSFWCYSSVVERLTAAHVFIPAPFPAASACMPCVCRDGDC